MSLPASSLSALKYDPGLLHFLVGQQPDQRLIVEIHDLNPVAPGIAEVAAEAGHEFELIFLGELSPDFLDLFLVAHDQAEVLPSVRLELLDLQDGHELVFAQFAPGCAFTAAEHLQPEHVRVELHGFLRVRHFDRDVVAAVYLNRHCFSRFPPHLILSPLLGERMGCGARRSTNCFRCSAISRAGQCTRSP